LSFVGIVECLKGLKLLKPTIFIAAFGLAVLVVSIFFAEFVI
jgi:uncharacterized membrane protein